jgi:hypothetical protein
MQNPGDPAAARGRAATFCITTAKARRQTSRHEAMQHPWAQPLGSFPSPSGHLWTSWRKPAPEAASGRAPRPRASAKGASTTRLVHRPRPHFRRRSLACAAAQAPAHSVAHCCARSSQPNLMPRRSIACRARPSCNLGPATIRAVCSRIGSNGGPAAGAGPAGQKPAARTWQQQPGDLCSHAVIHQEVGSTHGTGCTQTGSRQTAAHENPAPSVAPDSLRG